MKRAFFIMLFLMAVLPAWAQEEESPAENSLKNSAIRLRLWLESPENQRGNVQPYIDTINNVLFVDKNPVKVYAEMYAKFALYCYYITIEQTDKIDYTDLLKTLIITRKSKPFLTGYYLVCAYQAQEHYLKTKEYATLAYVGELTANCLSVGFPDRKDNYQLCLHQLGTSYSLANNYNKADSCMRLCETFVMLNGDDDDKHGFCTSWAEVKKELGDNQDAVALYQKANTYAKDPSAIFDNIIAIAQIQEHYGTGSDFLNTINEAVGMVERNYDVLEPYNVFCLAQLCNSENFDARKPREKLVATIEKNNSAKTPQNLINKAYVNFLAGKYQKANSYKKEALKLVDEGIKNGSLDEQSLTAILSVLRQTGDYEKLMEYNRINLATTEKLVGRRHQLYMEHLCLVLSEEILYGYNIQNVEKSADSLLRSSKKYSDGYYAALDLKAQLAQYKGQSLQAARYYMEVEGGKTALRDQYDVLLNVITSLIIEIDLANTNKDSRANIDSLTSALEQSVKRVTAISSKIFSGNSHGNFQVLVAQSSLAFIQKDKDKQLSVIKQMEAIISQNSNNEVRQEQIEMLANAYCLYGDYEKALALMKDSDPEIAINGQIKYDNYNFFAEANYLAGHTDKALRYYKQAVGLGIENVSKNFPVLTSAERSSYWNFFKQAFYDAGKYATSFGKGNEFNATLYDLALYSKGLLMRSQNATADKIKQLGDNSLIEKLELIKQLRMAVANGKNSGQSTATLERDAEMLEKELLQACAQKGCAFNDEIPDCKRIKTMLSAKDAAIEFILYYDKDTIGHYGALILRNNCQYPVLVHIAEKDSVEKNLFFNTKTSQIIWSPIMPYIKDVGTVYFSPTGALHKFAVEYLPYDNAEFVADMFNIVRVSSTAEIIRPRAKPDYKNVVVYGGIDYDAVPEDLQEIIALDTIPLLNKLESTTVIANADINQKRAGRSPDGKYQLLAGTLAEAVNISKVFVDADVRTVFYKEALATEESFKHLSGMRNDIIHVGTHGFCDIEEQDMPLTVADGRSNADGDYAMYNSGLIFAGYNNIYGNSFAGLEDARLTAKEISMMDFSFADLITLSACVTGGGDITGEGVFGVQRGFKLAGARSLMMSCWEVNDVATNMLMSDFYKNLISGMTKQKSLLESVRLVKSRYKLPTAWAAFILLDAVD